MRLADVAESYIATDNSGCMIAIAQEKLARAGQDSTSYQLSFRQATASTLASEGTRYDAVLGFNYLHLAGDLPTVLGNAAADGLRPRLSSSLDHREMEAMARSQKIEGLLFDLGGVLLNIDFNLAFQAWKKWTLLPIEELRSRFKMDEAYKKHERGEIGASQYFEHLRDVLELQASDSEIAIGWNAIFVDEIDETLSYISKIRSQQLPCFAFTNSNPTHQDYWFNKYPRVVNSFDKIFVSSDLGLRKPEKRSFEAISDATGISLGAILFFDDLEENVIGAENAGMPAVCVKNHADVKHALVEIGAL